MYLFSLTIEYRVIIGISAMVLLFTGFLISFITSQRKKLQYHKELQLLNDQQQRSLLDQNNLLEQRVNERTTELSHQKEALQNSLTELKTTQMQLIQREKMASLGELTAGIAHEIQNPLNFVNNFSEVSVDLLGELTEEATAGHTDDVLAIAADLSKNLQKIAHHGGRASAIVKSMLEHSRASSGEKQPTDLNSLAEEYLRLAYQGQRSKTKEFNCRLDTNFEPGLPLVSVVPQEIGRVLLNLYTNAFYALSERARNRQADEPEDLTASVSYQPTVWVRTRLLTNGVEIHVEDNGTGIPASVQGKIFQPFFTTKPTGEGTGLGLSLSYDIITKGHGGRLALQTQPGEGTEFTITLPVSVIVRP